MISQTTRVIDPHLHIWQPDFLPPALRMSWAQDAAYRRDDGTAPETIYPKVSQHLDDPRGNHLLAAMDIAGVARGVVLGVDYGPEEWAATPVPAPVVMRRYEAICRASGGRLSYAAGVDPRRADAPQLAREYLASDFCRGLKLYPPAGFTADAPECEALYQAVAEAGKTVVFHTAMTRGRLRWRNAWPVHIAEVQARHPELTIVLGHSGFPLWWDECVALAAAHPRTYMELSLWQKEALSEGSDFTRRLERAISHVGADRVLFASDTMYGERLKGAADWARWVEYMCDLPEATQGRVTAAHVKRMVHDNALAAYFGGDRR